MKKGGFLKFVAGVAIGVLAARVVLDNSRKKAISQKEEKINKFKGYYNLLNQWLVIKNTGKSLDEYFVKHNYRTIAIYGMGELGNRLYEELLACDKVIVKYAIDKDTTSIIPELPIYSIDEELKEVDVIVVTATFVFNEVEESLKNITTSPIISIEALVNEL